MSWDEALGVVADKLKAARPERIAAIAGDLAGAEEMFALGHLLVLLGSPNFDCRQDGAKLDPRLGRASYLFNTTIEGIERADAILLVGTNPRLEASLVNARIRKRWRHGGLAVGLIGDRVDLTYGYDYLGAGPQTLKEVADGKQGFSKVLREAKHPMVIVGAAAAARADGAGVLAAAAHIALTAMRGKDGGLERLQRAERGRFAGRRPRPRLRSGRGRARRGGHARGRRQGCPRRGLPLGRR